MINWSNSHAYNMNTHSWSNHRYPIFKRAPNLLASQLASSCTSRSDKMVLFYFSFKQFHKLTWNITFSGLSTMSCCYLKHLNDNFSGFIFCEEKKIIYSVWPENSSTPTRICHRYQFLSKRTFQSGRRYSQLYWRNIKLI